MFPSVVAITPPFLQDPGTSFFLFGPRGTGKSTWLRKRFPDAIHLDRLDPERERRYRARPERLRECLTAEPSSVVVLDEAQRAPELLPLVDQLIESDSGRRFVPTGSRAFREDYPEARAALLYLGDERLRDGEIDCVPVGDWLKAVDPTAPLP